MRQLGAAFIVAVLIALIPAILETALSDPVSRPTPGDFLYGIDVHWLLALVAVVLARLVALRRSPRTFFTLGLAFQLAIEGGLTAGFWFGTRAGFLPSPATATGKAALIAFGGGCGLAGLAVGIVAGRRGFARWMERLADGFLGRLGAVACGLLVVANLVALAVARPHRPSVVVRPDAEKLQRPDVLVILVDTLRRDHLSWWGYGRPTSPNLDRFFDDSIVFTNAYTPSTWTMPSVASLFTGRYPTSHRIDDPTDALPRSLPTLAEHFRSYGYATGGFVGNNLMTRYNGFSQGFAHYYPRELPYWCRNLRTAGEKILKQLLQQPDVANRAGPIARAAVRWLRATPGKPHFAYLHFMDPHSPYTPPRAARERVAPGAPPGPINPPELRQFNERLRGTGCADWSCIEDPPTLPDRDLLGMIANYDGEILAVDDAFGVLMAGLAELGYLETCHIVFCTDHGEEFGDHRGWFHRASIHDEMIACPLAYRPPGGVAGGRTMARPIPMIDIIPTLCGQVGIETPPQHQGRKIPEVSGDPPPAYTWPVLSETPPYLYALRLRNWKAIRQGPTASPQWLLFDLDRDPLERTDLAAELPDTLGLLREYLEELTATLARQGEVFTPSAENPELLRRLRDLGYID